MKVVFILAFLAMLNIAVNAYCPNLCSGHGSCGTNDQCTCYTQKGTASGYDGGGASASRAAWTGADCSLRTCPVSVSWVGATATGAPKATNSLTIASGGNDAHKIVTAAHPGAGNTDISADCDAGKIVLDHSSDANKNQYLKGDKVYVYHDGYLGLGYEFTVYSIACSSGVYTFITYEEIPSALVTAMNAGNHKVHVLGKDDDKANTLAKPATARGVHAVLECAGQGLCNRETGQCECFAGYEGEACARTACPSDCSGHGVCVSMKDLVDDAAAEYSTQHGLFVASDEATNFAGGGATMKQYNGWDVRKEYGCKCDAGFRGPDCSEHECPSHVDPMKGCGGGSCNMANGWTDIVPYDSSSASSVTDSDGNVAISYSKCSVTATGCSTSEQRDCSGRGICDYSTGSCNCFSGFYGEACEIQTILV